MSIVIRKFERIGFNDVYFLLLINSEYVTFLSIRNGVDTKKRKLLGLIVTVAILFLGTGFGFPVGQLPLLSLGKSLMTTSPGAIPPTFNIEVDTSNDTGQHTSVAFNWWDGHTYVSYYNATIKELRMAYDIGSGGNCGPDDSWLCLTVDSDGDVGQYNSIAVGAGFVNISYHDASNGDLKWAESTDPPLYTFWKIRTIDRGGSTTTAGLFTSINLFDGKYPRISYYSDNSGDVDELRLASYIGSSGGNCGWGDDAGKWNCRTIKTGEGVGQHASMMHDSNWHKYIAYYDATNGGLWMATNKSGSNCGPGGNSWSCFPVSVPSANVGKYSSFYLDSSNQYHIAYYDATNDTLRYAHEVGSGGNCGVLGGAQCDTIDTMQADYHPVGISIAEDSSGFPVIAYQSWTGSLMVARPLAGLGLPAGSGNCGPQTPFFTWSCQIINPQNPWVPARHGDYLSLAVNPSGLVTIAYYGFITPSGGNLMVASQQFKLYQPFVLKGQ